MNNQIVVLMDDKALPDSNFVADHTHNLLQNLARNVDVNQLRDQPAYDHHRDDVQ